MKIIKGMLKVTALIFAIFVLQFVLLINASAAMSADDIADKLGKYSLWIEDISDSKVELKCPDANIDEDYYSDMINNIVDNLKGEMGADYCYATIFIEYDAELYNADMDTFKNEMFEIERHLNICWPEWSGRDGVNFSVGAYIYSDGTIASFFVEVQLKINGQGEDSEYFDYNARLKQIVDAAESTCNSDEELVKYYCDWILDNITYDIKESSTNSACEALLKGKAVCGGFANLLRDLCRESGITAIVPTSTELNHAWNEIHLNGVWYSVDLLNVVGPKSNRYTNTYFFTDPDGDCDYAQQVEAIKGKLYAFSFVGEDGLTWKLNTNYDRLTLTGKGEMQNFNWEDIFPSWIDYLGFSEVYVSYGITSIGDYAFWDAFGYGGLKTVYLPSTIEYIGEGAFLDCYDLENIYFDGTEEQWNNISKSSDLDDALSAVTVNFVEEEIHIHSYGNWIVESEASCTADGKKYKQCSGCSEKIEEVIAATGHNYSHITTQPTCTTRGYTTHICTNCDDTYIDTYVNANGHSMADWETVSASTCIETGEKKRVCNNCSYSETETIEVTDHPYSDKWTIDVAQSCTTAGSKSRHCTYCSASTDVIVIEPDGHDYSSVITAPTCVSAGYTTYTCHCGDSYVSDEKAAFGHSFGDWIKTVTPSCEKAGSETRQCSACTYKESRAIDALGHSYNTVWTTDKEPTCTEDGYKSHHCTRCGNKTDITVIESDGHKYDAVVTPVTCLADGYTTYICHCGDTYVSDYVYTKGHTKVTDPAKEPTCTSTGLTEGEHCSVCNTVIVEQKVINKIPHNYTETVIPATCTTDGKKIYECNCGDSYTEVISSTGHSYSEEWTTDTEATCVSKGSKSRHCQNCDAVTDVTEIPVEEHDIESTVFLPSCTEEGYTHNECKNCTFEETVNVQPAAGHSLGKAYTVKEATCTTEGSERANCDNCDYYEVTAIQKAPHDYESTVHAPTCTDDGYTEHKCTECNDSYSDDYKSKTDHSMGEYVTDYDATCVKDGSKTRRCENCEYYETETIDATGKHIYDEYVSDNNASCLHDGTLTARCNTCDKTHTVTDAGSAKGHKEVVDTGTPATCTSIGLTDGKHCSKCGQIIVEQEIIPQTEHIDSNEDGYCDDCDTSTKESSDCDCMCHKDGIMGFFYKIVRIFWKLFGMNKICDCGAYHY